MRLHATQTTSCSNSPPPPFPPSRTPAAFYNFDGHIGGPAIYQFQQVEARGGIFWEPLVLAIGLAETWRVAVGWATPTGTGFNSLKVRARLRGRACACMRCMGLAPACMCEKLLKLLGSCNALTPPPQIHP